MPVLKEYSEDYDKVGYYVHAPVEGVSHPIPLQTPDITAQIYRDLGYEAGDHVPNELTWKLYNANLHWTESTGAEQATKDDIEEAILAEDGPEFTENQAEVILSLVESYSGRFETELDSLVEELEIGSTTDVEYSSNSTESNSKHEYFGRQFNNIDNPHVIDNLRTLERHGCIYARFRLKASDFDILNEDEFRLCRIDFTPEEIVEYIEARTAYEEYLGYKNQGMSSEEAVENISNGRIRQRVKEDERTVPASFLGAELEALVCGTRPNRYEIIPRSKI